MPSIPEQRNREIQQRRIRHGAIKLITGGVLHFTLQRNLLKNCSIICLADYYLDGVIAE
jgi:hypothetical protein